MISGPCSATAMFFLLAVMAAARAGDDKATAAQNLPAAPVKKDPKSRHVLVTISKETTYITEPLRKDGYVDYVAALNERASKGVTPENNAAVLIWQAVGPGEIAKPYREEYFKRLGIPTPPDSGDYFIPFEKYVAVRRETLKTAGAEVNETESRAAADFMRSRRWRPWSREDFPVLARWLAANEKSLSTVVEASKRPRRYDPLVARDVVPLIAVLMPAIGEYYSLTRALITRAMLRSSEGKTNAALADLLAVHRLARLIGQGPTLIDAVDAYHVDGLACAGDEAMLQHGRLSAPEAASMLSDLRKLAHLPRIVDKIDTGERFEFLDSMAFAARDGFRGLAPAKLNSAIVAKIDCDVVLRFGNSSFDQWVAALRKPKWGDRTAALDKLDREFRAIAAQPMDWESLLAGPKDAVSRRAAEILVGMMMPRLNLNGDDQGQMEFELANLGFAMAVYRADRGVYPTKLVDLRPKYMDEIPRDVFNDEELHYKRDGDGYLIYSVGINGVDDGGKGYIDRIKDEKWDDLSVRVADSVKVAPKP